MPRSLSRLGSDLREILQEQIDYRELLFTIVHRDLLLRYKQTIMGFGWAIFMPVLNTLIFTIIFTRVTRLDTGGIPYPVYAFAGLLPWNFFATSLRFSVSSLTGNSGLVTKVYFPRELFPFSAVLVSLIDFGVAATVLVALMGYYHIGVTWAALAAPIVLLVQLVFTLGMALLLSMANLFYRDVKYLFEIVITVWMFATSVVYPVELVGGRLGALLMLNPMTPIIDGYRAVLLRGTLPPPLPFAGATVLAVATLAVGWVLFHRAEFRFAESV
jgi:lipopolysaccharide transport system permease protein